MTSDRWRRVEEIYHAASERPASERGAYLAEACDGDGDLRREVEELLEQSTDQASILDRPVRELLEAELQPGQMLGPYRIVELIGSGGMGRVYKAVDTRLGRSVAIKVSRAGFTARFRREAQAVAALNHPNICTLYDLGPNYLVMEYVEGAPIKGPMPLPQALKAAIAIAAALDAAHRKGVIHRDLKPANILLTDSGPKLLDFGLAKLEPTPGNGISNSVTVASTGQATIAGTIQYMSPEQLQGRGADARSDIFSFGLVLFEMLAGRPAFEADNPASLIAAILTAHPRVRDSVPLLPAELEHVLDRALAKDPEDRWQSARDLKAALEWIAASSTAPPPPPVVAAPRGSSRLAWALAIVFCVIAAGLAIFAIGPKVVRLSRTEETRQRTESHLPEMMLLDRGGRKLMTLATSAECSNPAISPDGRRLAVSIRDPKRVRHIWIFGLGKGERAPLTDDPADTTNPVWSPDGSEIAYCSERLGHRDLYVRSSNGGPARLLLATDGNKNPMDWARDGSSIYYNDDRPGGGHDLWMLPLTGKDRTPRLFIHDSTSTDWLALSPNGRWVVYRSGSQQESTLLLRPLRSAVGDWPIGVVGTAEAHWRADGGQIYFVSGSVMMAQDVKTAGSSVRLSAPVPLFRVPRLTTFGRNAFSVSPDGSRFLIVTGQ